MQRIKYFISNDKTSAYFFEKSEEIIKDNLNIEIDNINQAIELFNCTRYLESKNPVSDKSEESLKEIKKDCTKIKRNIAYYFSKFTADNLIQNIKNIEYIYKEDFLYVFCVYKVFERIDENQLQKIIDLNIITLQNLCEHEILVKHFEKFIKKSFIQNPISVEILLNKYVIKKESTESKKIYLPQSLSKTDINKLIIEYIGSDEANLNYLRVINKTKSNSEFGVSDYAKYLAEVRVKELEEIHFKKDSGFAFGYQIIFQNNLEEPVIANLDGNEASIKFDKTWLEKHLDFATIFQNFIWLFNFIDSNGRITSVSHPNDISAFENVISGLKTKNDYIKGHVFESNNILIDLITTGYYMFLKEKEVPLENAIEWFFTKYLEEEFNIDNYIFNSPSQSTTYLEKCRNIFPEMESIFLQYKNFVETKKINHEFLGISSSGVAIDHIPSLIEKKYIYATEKLNLPLYYLFSDQTSLGYIENENKNSKNLYELLLTHKVFISEFHEFQKAILEQLIESNYLIINNDESVSFKNLARIKILYELYYRDAISYYRAHELIQNEIELMLEEDLLKVGSSLFSVPEQEYFDYYLNNHRFQNGMQLRNKYSHGRSNFEKSEHSKNYMIAIKLMILTILKINEELCLFESINKLKK